MRKILLIGMIFWGCESCGSLGYVPNSHIMSIPYQSQLESYWCWAASVQMINNSIFPNAQKSQCQIFQLIRYSSDFEGCSFSEYSSPNCECINYIKNPNCNKLLPLERDDSMPIETNHFIENLRCRLNIQSSVHFGKLEWNTLKRTMRLNSVSSPLLLNVQLFGSAGSSHMVVVDGYDDSPNGTKIHILDPWNPQLSPDDGMSSHGSNCATESSGWHNYALLKGSSQVVQEGDYGSIYQTFYNLGTKFQETQRPENPERPRKKNGILVDPQPQISPPKPILTTPFIEKEIVDFAIKNYQEFQPRHKELGELSNGAVKKDIHGFAVLNFSLNNLHDTTRSQFLNNPFVHVNPIRFAVLSEQMNIPQINIASTLNGFEIESITSNPWIACSIDPTTNKKVCSTEMSLKVDNQNIKLGKNSIDYEFATSYYFGYIFLRFKYQNKIYYASRSSYKNLSINGTPHSAFTAYEEPILLEALHQRAVSDRILHSIPNGSALYSR